MILLLDNYDSFTYNIEQYFRQLSANVMVHKNDALTLTDIERLQPKAIILGPGPGTPDDAGITLDTIRHFAGKVPLLGVCLGHQAIAQAFGGNVVAAQQVMHGRTSKVYHHQTGVFTNIAIPTTVTRYHSLLVDKVSLPDTLEITGWTQPIIDNSNNSDESTTVELQDKTLRAHNKFEQVFEIMAIRHKTLPIEGVQFHPESILSDSGLQVFKNFLIQHHLMKS